MCLAQGPQCSDAGEAWTHAPRSWVKHSTTEPLGSHNIAHLYNSAVEIQIRITNNFKNEMMTY